MCALILSSYHREATERLGLSERGVMIRDGQDQQHDGNHEDQDASSVAGRNGQQRERDRDQE